MKVIKFIAMICIFAIIAIGVRTLLPTEIVDTHYIKRFKKNDIIVKNFPLTDYGKINWWESNQIILKKKYNIPIKEDDYGVTFWAGDYKEDSGTDQDSDLYCFEGMTSKANCMEKSNIQMTVWYKKSNGETTFYFDDWTRVYLKYDATNKIRRRGELEYRIIRNNSN